MYGSQVIMVGKDQCRNFTIQIENYFERTMILKIPKASLDFVIAW